MSSVQHLREFISERLNAAAEEIFGVFHKTIVQYEEELHRQRRLLDVSWKPDKMLQRKELLRTFPGGKENSNVSQEEAEPPHVKEEHQELCIDQDEEQLDLKKHSGPSVDSLTYEGSFQSEPDPNRPHLVSDNDSESESPDQESSWQEEPELKLKRQNQARSQPDRNLCELWSGLEVDQLVLKQGTDVTSPARDGGDDRETEPFSNLPFCDSLYVSKNQNQEEPQRTKKQVRKRKNRDSAADPRELGSETALRCVTCDICGKVFSGKTDMRAHYRVHTGEKPFSCQICHKAFSQRFNLSVHMRIHTGEKPHECEFCGKGFSDASSLRKHTVVHTGEKPYSCEVCGKCFNRSSHLWRHVKLHARDGISS